MFIGEGRVPLGTLIPLITKDITTDCNVWAKVYLQRSVHWRTKKIKRATNRKGGAGGQENERVCWLTRTSNLTSDTKTRAKKRG